MVQKERWCMSVRCLVTRRERLMNRMKKGTNINVDCRAWYPEIAPPIWTTDMWSILLLNWKIQYVTLLRVLLSALQRNILDTSSMKAPLILSFTCLCMLILRRNMYYTYVIFLVDKLSQKVEFDSGFWKMICTGLWLSSITGKHDFPWPGNMKRRTCLENFTLWHHRQKRNILLEMLKGQGISAFLKNNTHMHLTQTYRR